MIEFLHPSRLAVRPVAGAQLVEAAARDARVPTSLDHRDHPARDAINDVLAHPCQTVRRSHRAHASVERNVNGRSVPVAPFHVSQIAKVSALNLGSTV